MGLIGIIGGSGLYDSHALTNVETHNVHTPYGNPSSEIIIGTFHGKKIAFLPRHGKGHVFNPSAINYRANVFALKELGVNRVIGISAVGSLQENIRPGELVVLDQFIDRTQARKQSFYEGSKVCHVSMAEPFCPDLREHINHYLSALAIPHHEEGTYVCIEGPRFSTKSESRLYKSWNGHVIGMTLVPEVVLAREAQMCYSTVALVTDYDSFKEHPVTTEEVIRTMKDNVFKARQLLESLIPSLSEKGNCSCHEALKSAFI
jgi:5'-methylthioadenosine phosphorylase